MDYFSGNCQKATTTLPKRTDLDGFWRDSIQTVENCLPDPQLRKTKATNFFLKKHHINGRESRMAKIIFQMKDKIGRLTLPDFRQCGIGIKINVQINGI